MNIPHARLTSLQDADTAVKALATVGGVAGGMLQLAVPDAFFWLFLILIASNAADWIFGRHAARARSEFSSMVSRNGLTGKGAQLCVLLLLRSLEYVIPLSGLPSTMGIGSSALALALIVEDLGSMERHIIDLGGSRIPGLSALLDRIRVATGGDRRTRDRETDHHRRLGDEGENHAH